MVENGKNRKYILETGDQYPRKVCFQLFGDRVDQFPMAVGEEVVVSCDIESREYNGRWYTNVSAWKIDKVAVSAPMEGAIPPPPFEPEPTEDDLTVLKEGVFIRKSFVYNIVIYRQL